MQPPGQSCIQRVIDQALRALFMTAQARQTVFCGTMDKTPRVQYGVHAPQYVQQFAAY